MAVAQQQQLMSLTFDRHITVIVIIFSKGKYLKKKTIVWQREGDREKKSDKRKEKRGLGHSDNRRKKFLSGWAVCAAGKVAGINKHLFCRLQ